MRKTPRTTFGLVLCIGVLAASSWVLITVSLAVEKQGPAAQPGGPTAEGPKTGGKPKAANLVFQSASLVRYADEVYHATGKDEVLKFSVPHRTTGVKERLYADWDTVDVPSAALDRAIKQKTYSLRVNEVNVPAKVERMGQRHLRTTFEVASSYSWPIRVQFLMNAPAAERAKPQDVAATKPPAVQRTDGKPEPGDRLSKPDRQSPPSRGPNLDQPGRQISADDRTVDPPKRGEPKPAAGKPKPTGPVATRLDHYEYTSVVIRFNLEHFDYFTRYIYPTFQHDRCTTCHSMGSTQAILDQHHKDKVGGASGVPDDSRACSNCHGDVRKATETNSKTPAKFLGDLGKFTDFEWKSPAFSKDINWREKKNAMHVCNTVVAHLNTPAKLKKHFHNDARLAWAVSASDIDFQVAGGLFGKKESAPPGDFAEFLKRIDRWIAYGFPCRP